MPGALVPVFLAAIWGLPTVAALYPALAAHDSWLRVLALLAAPVTFGCLFVGVSGVLSLPFQKAIVAGKFPRRLSHPVYGPRRLYGLCWTSIFYNLPLYHALLGVPALRAVLFRLLGYRGNLDFVVYPDTWIRDLPLLRIGEKAYLANKSTIGTNLCLQSGDILVDGIRIDAGAVVGHLVMLAPGVSLGEGAETGVGAAIGIRARIGRDSRIGPGCGINHGASIGEKTEIGPLSYVGVRAVIRDGLRLPGGSNIPSGAVLSTQEDVTRYLSSETELLNSLRERLAQLHGARDGKAVDPGERPAAEDATPEGGSTDAP